MKIVTAVSIVALLTLTAPLATPAAASQLVPVSQAPTSGTAPEEIAKPLPGVTIEADRISAESAAQGWLSLLDAGNYAQSWSAASALLREGTSESQWRSKMTIGRFQLGALKSRGLLSEKFVCGGVRNSDLPDGKYAVVQFHSRFLWFRQEDVIEIVIMRKDGDGIWRVADFYIADGPSFSGYWQLPPGKPCK